MIALLCILMLPSVNKLCGRQCFGVKATWHKCRLLNYPSIDLTGILVHTPHPVVSTYLYPLESRKTCAIAVAPTPDLPVHRPFGQIRVLQYIATG